MKNVTVLNHPVLKHKLRLLRDQRTKSHEFRRVLNEISMLMAYEATKHLPLKSEQIKTPLEKTKAQKIAPTVCIASILRAGEGMAQAFAEALPFARVGHIGIFRDEATLNSVEYYLKLPKKISGSYVLLVDPMLATGNTAVAAIDRLKQRKVKSIRFICILSSKVGIRRVHAAHPNVEIITLSVERGLNSHGYLLPGLGDAGDRIFGTN